VEEILNFKENEMGLRKSKCRKRKNQKEGEFTTQKQEDIM
jgi:hypothetical protein